MGTLVKKLYGCQLVNLNVIHWFNTKLEAIDYGDSSNLPYVIVSEMESNLKGKRTTMAERDIEWGSCLTPHN